MLQLEAGLGNLEQIEQRARGGFRIAEGAMASAIGDTEVGTQVIQVVTAELGHQPARELSRAEHRTAVGGKPTQIECTARESVIEGRIVGDEGRRGRSIEPARERAQRALRCGGLGDHRVTDPGQCDDRARHSTRRAQQGFEAVDDAQLRDPDRADLEDRRALDVEAGRLEVDDDEIGGCDALLGDLELAGGPQIRGTESVGQRMRRAVERETHDATRERWIDRAVAREQLACDLDEIHGLSAGAEPIQ